MKNIQNKWNSIINLTNDENHILQGLRNTLFLDMNRRKLSIKDKIIFQIRFVLLFLAVPKKIKISTNKKYLFLFPYTTPAIFENLFPIYEKFSKSDSIVILNDSDSNVKIKVDYYIKLKSIFRSSSYITRIMVFYKDTSFKKLLSRSKGTEFEEVIKKFKVKYIYYIFIINLVKKATRNLLINTNIAHIISTSDYFPIEYGIFIECNNLKINTYLIQHGVIGVSYYPFTAKYLFVWGHLFKSEIVKMGANKRNIHVIGWPQRDMNLLDIKKSATLNKTKKFLILSDTQGASIYPDVYRKYSDFLRSIKPDLKAEWIVKLHPAEEKKYYFQFFSKNLISILDRTTTLKQALEKCDVVFTIWSTAGLSAIINDIPTVVLDLDDSVKRYAWWPLYGGGIYYSQIDNDYTKLFNDEHLSSIRDNQRNFASKAFAIENNPAFKIKTFIQGVDDDSI